MRWKARCWGDVGRRRRRGRVPWRSACGYGAAGVSSLALLCLCVCVYGVVVVVVD